MLKLATVFSGIGAIEHALEKMNIPFETVFACEIDKNTRECYKANHIIKDEVFYEDIRNLDANQYKGQVDLFVGGSPCQSFSIAGLKAGLEDTRGTLFFEFARIVKEVQPKVFIYENVKHLLHHDKGNTWKVIQDVFDSLGYDYKFKVLNAKNYGIPQNRERIFVIGFQKNFRETLPKKIRDWSFPSPKKLEIYLQDLLEAPQKISEKYYLSEKMKKYVLSLGTKGFYNPPDIDRPIGHTLVATYYKMHRAGVDNYVTTNGRLRRLTPRECLRLMGFSDSFKITHSDTSMYKMAGNSIVVDVLVEVLKSIYIDELF